MNRILRLVDGPRYFKHQRVRVVFDTCEDAEGSVVLVNETSASILVEVDGRLLCFLRTELAVA